ncbi:MAG: hypothetical protein C7B43_16230 [Sulfobacillus benefaciens]|uniref:Uncharacterized protein n=1 Tax=Sulfobacillus benefaciens TaxID=453960 RepID=A0A2T2WU39_9FIRM|nr:MAG: hypothetical protein C7B43_16230 [Sulfobacillus benefaciens]
MDSTSPASSHYMHTVLWAPPEINHFVVPEDTLRHKLDTWHAGDLNLTWASTAAGMAVSLFGALCTTSMPAFTRGVFVTLTLTFFVIAAITGLKYEKQHKTSDEIVDEIKQTLTPHPSAQIPSTIHDSSHSPSVGS